MNVEVVYWMKSKEKRTRNRYRKERWTEGE